MQELRWHASKLAYARCLFAGTRAEPVPMRFNNDYEDLRTITSRDDHGCTSNRLIGIY